MSEGYSHDSYRNLSFVIPAYNAARTIRRCLDSIFNAESVRGYFDLQVIVIDDGSKDVHLLREELEAYTNVELYEEQSNCGKLAVVNRGLDFTQGSTVVQLDADDALLPNWPETLRKLFEQWPDDCKVACTVCMNAVGEETVSRPQYQGRLNLEQRLREEFTGEYLCVFRGDYIRAKGFVDLGVRSVPSEEMSYIEMLKDGPFWLSPLVLRRYYDQEKSSLSKDLESVEKAKEKVLVLNFLLEKYGSLYQEHAPLMFRKKLLRRSVYKHIGNLEGVWSDLKRGASLRIPFDTVGAFLMITIGSASVPFLVKWGKSLGLIKAYG